VRARPFGSGCDAGAYEAGSTIVRISDETTDFDPEDFATATPSGGLLVVIPGKDYNCRYGNSTVFDIADTLKANGEYAPVGIGPDMLWLQFKGPTYGELCWAPVSGFVLYLNGAEIPLAQISRDLLPTVSYPPLPTATPDPDEGQSAEPSPTVCPTLANKPGSCK